MMESQPAEALKNNVLGTAVVAGLAAEHGAAKFVLISSDKAVNPTNVMGASKRLAERVVRAMQAQRRRQDELPGRPLRQRARFFRLGHPDLPSADRGRRSRHGDPPGR
jgi:FlaA1/EpsC-like NDP-sugar epimerase